MNSNVVEGPKHKSLSIRGRLFLGFAVLISPILLISALCLYKINTIASFTDRIVQVVLPTQDIANALQSQIYASQLATYEWLLTGNPKAQTQFNNVWKTMKFSQNKLDAISSKWVVPELRNRWNLLRMLYPKLENIQKKIMALSEGSNYNTIKNMIESDENPIINQMILLTSGSTDFSEVGKGSLFEIQTKDLYSKALTIMEDVSILRSVAIFLLIISVLLALIVSIITSKKILEPIKAYSLHSSKIAGGDLTQRLVIERSDEMGRLGTDLNIMTEGLYNITKKITEASKKMVNTLEEVQSVSDMQSAGVSEQASSINEITASLEEIDKSATQTMEKAQKLGQIAEQTSQKGQMGLDAVQQSIEGMSAIRDKVQTIAQTILELSNQTQQVGEITAVVNTLALQSQMLALNASIEASKAGDAGKGFAVVAAEVKSLADQSAQSTTQVQKIIEDIRHATEKAVLVTEEGTKGVDHGTALVEQMGEIVHTLTKAINETMIASQQIETAVRQESLGIEQITAGMNEINQVTASFVNTVKQTTESIAHLGDVAKSINSSVESYKV